MILSAPKEQIILHEEITDTARSYGIVPVIICTLGSYFSFFSIHLKQFNFV